MNQESLGHLMYETLSALSGEKGSALKFQGQGPGVEESEAFSMT